MKQEFINASGMKVQAAQTIQAAFDQEHISLSNASPYSESIQVSGYRYQDGHVDSFGQLFDAAAIRMIQGQQITWSSYSEYDASSSIRCDATNGAVLVFEYAMGNGSAYPQPNGYFELSVDGTPCVRFSLKKYNCLFPGVQGTRMYLEIHRKRVVSRPGDQFTLDPFVQNESTYVNGLAYLYLPKEWIHGKTALTLSIAACPQAGEVSQRWLRVGFGFYWLNCRVEEGVNHVLRGLPRRTLDGQNIFFGDIHVHTAQSGVLEDDGCGIGSVASNLAYARDVARLDFCAIADHDWQLDAQDWQLLRETNNEMNQDGEFVTIQAYEWTSANYGHRNVYFRDGTEIPDGLRLFDSQAEPFTYQKYGSRSDHDPTPADLWKWLEDHHLEAMTFPHHPNSEQFIMDFNHFFNEKYDRCVEVYSSWGCFFREDHPMNICSARIPGYGFSRYAGKKHFGFVASSDGHDGNGGDANVSKDKRHIGHYAGSGHVAVLCDHLTRAKVYDAMYARRCYAVTGEPILLNLHLGHATMGERIHCDGQKATLEIRVQGTAPLLHATWYRNSTPLLSIPVNGTENLSFTQQFQPEPESSYWLEVCQEDGEYAWSSPIFCE